jgi:hypothetical protein
MLTGCAASGGAKVQPVNLPDAPACMAPVPVPVVAAGDDARAQIARHRAALLSANGNLKCSYRWYGELRSSYSRTK